MEIKYVSIRCNSAQVTFILVDIKGFITSKHYATCVPQPSYTKYVHINTERKFYQQ